ncbi:hypothetical protein [Enhygromyxa salina]|uniref:Uncharacterized protein n=1 Tax=Enhygromyxa salina TaxID=215803 RepID=A0A2S9XIF8_9BACT|nr:hypothetical protein [Enhygromyxa salina]PRP92669.1 hypothetical protein ENSA7_81580 [Enhygromyxa salina]
MTIGAYIMTQIGGQGSHSFKALPGDLDCAITEIRIEEHLDKPATFAIRFQEDFEDGENGTFTAADLRGSKGIAIAVSSGPGHGTDGLAKVPLPPAEELVCLIRGQIENSQADLSPGGSGSTLEVRGRDIRTTLDRENKPQEFSGTNTDIFKKMIDGLGDTAPDIGPDVLEFPTEGASFNYLGTILDGLERLATACNYSVWLRYNLTLSTSVYDVTPKVSIKTSPERAAHSPADLNLGLTRNSKVTLRIIGSETACENVINFSHTTDSEAITCVSSAGDNHETGESYNQDQSADHDPTTEDAGETNETAGAKDCERSMFVSTVGGADRVGSTAQAAANDASWYVKASALTTVHMLGTVLRPHDLVLVHGGGCGVSGGFQVEKVTHVINAAAHWMNIELRSNSRSVSPPKEGLLGG